MSLSSFNALLKMLSPVLTSNGKYAIMGGLEPISCELMLHFAIRYLAGGSFYDVWATAIISKPSFHRLVWHIIDCINRCDALAVKLPGPNELDKVWQGFEAFSWDGVLNGCIGALVGYLQCIAAPSHKECGNVGAYFSGHYCVYGVNLQAMCDAYYHFLFVSVAAPGKTNNSVAVQKTSLQAWVEALPPGYFIAMDCAYSLSEHVITPYPGPQCYSECSDNFNFFITATNPN